MNGSNRYLGRQTSASRHRSAESVSGNSDRSSLADTADSLPYRSRTRRAASSGSGANFATSACAVMYLGRVTSITTPDSAGATLELEVCRDALLENVRVFRDGVQQVDRLVREFEDLTALT